MKDASGEKISHYHLAPCIYIMEDLARQVLSGDMRAAAKLLTLIERGEPQARKIVKAFYPHTGRAHVVGITGSTGSGKSTLIDGLIGLLRKKRAQVGVLAVDPTSPLSGGAILGDRIRMRSHLTDPGVFIRSIASRGAPGGLPVSIIAQAVQVLDVLGLDKIFVETLGIGQDQVAVRSVAHTVLVLVTPGIGDEVQTLKAGFLEIADLYVVNKADLPGAQAMVKQLMEVAQERPVLVVSALRKEGLNDLSQKIADHQICLETAHGRLGSPVKIMGGRPP